MAERNLRLRAREIAAVDVLGEVELVPHSHGTSQGVPGDRRLTLEDGTVVVLSAEQYEREVEEVPAKRKG